ncbi:hypothetical protein OH76DRAFT_1233791 [Lentinus brumalis]|uniref:Uncharacterized protein n=1 Tax=Lentinus brumalis TaxID=2498619 RepID=A0A371CSG1_9APHY|nr:hypothetical protein OH76DRAFT_1233791 [Polyporus brumalis]
MTPRKDASSESLQLGRGLTEDAGTYMNLGQFCIDDPRTVSSHLRRPQRFPRRDLLHQGHCPPFAPHREPPSALPFPAFSNIRRLCPRLVRRADRSRCWAGRIRGRSLRAEVGGGERRHSRRQRRVRGVDIGIQHALERGRNGEM